LQRQSTAPGRPLPSAPTKRYATNELLLCLFNASGFSTASFRKNNPMIQKIILLSCIAVILMMMTQCKRPGAYPEKLDKLVAGASLIFKGKIVLLHTATTDESDVTNTGVVTVTEVIEAPESFPSISGQQVTVRVTDINKVKVGEERLFFTDPYWIGESIGVREIGSVMKGDKLYENKDISSLIKQGRDKQGDEQLGKTLKGARLVVTGKVVKISEPEGKIRIGTEHDPEWKEAEIQIDETLKGTADKTVKILFASSKDVMFFKAPKFKEGDEGIFIIQQTDSQTAKLLRNDNMAKLSFYL
jgi:hypothetical protein